MTTATRASPWGVQLRSTEKGDDLKKGCDISERPSVSASSRLEEDAAAERDIHKKRTSLRKVNLPPRTSRRTRSRSRSRSRRRYAKPGGKFSLRKSPVFGVVLRPRSKLGTILEHEEYVDLDFQETSQSGSSSDGSSFGVRLKPNRRSSSNGKSSSPNQTANHTRTYQIDLNPPTQDEHGRQLDAGGMDSSAASYQPDSCKSFLEIKLSPIVEKGDAATSEELVELQMRHVVAPADGGPKRTVTQAVVQIPLLDKVPTKTKRRGWRQEPLQDLLQIVVANSSVEEALQKIQIELRHVNPVTQEKINLEHLIEITVTTNTSGNDDKAPSMQVQIVACASEKCGRWSTGSKKDCAPCKVRLKHVQVEEEDDHSTYTSTTDCTLDHSEQSYSNSSVEYDFDGSSGSTAPPSVRSRSHGDLDDLTEESDRPTIDSKTKRSSCPNIRLEMQPMMSGNSTNHSVESMPSIEEQEEEPPDPPPPENKFKEGDAKRQSRCTMRKPRRQRSRSLTDIDRMKDKARLREEAKKAEQARKAAEEKLQRAAQKQAEMDRIYEKARLKEEARKAAVQQQKLAQQKKAATKLSQQKRRDLLMWYSRMQTPSKEEMKRKVANLPKGCDITPEDVEQLPWVCRGKYLNLKRMNDMFLEDGKQQKDDGASSDTTTEDATE